jgi:CubicO group peptidase (beta-lactamase class C family)
MLATLGFGQEPPTVIARGREGFNDRDPDRPGHAVPVYSMTKPVTGMAAMILI